MDKHLKANRNEYDADLIDAYLKDAPFIETQVNIRTDIGEPRSRKLPNGRTINYRVDGNTAFANIRYPRQAATPRRSGTTTAISGGPSQPMPKESAPPGLLKRGVGGWGTTWTRSGATRACALTDGELGDIRRAIERPLRGNSAVYERRGFHLYLLLDGIEVANHTEHAGLAPRVAGHVLQ